ncbi:MAG: hypothetical protein LLG37_10090 [Spirochaetia bacterium]|nr:hypothetical protein [Spirochaetia bacterium]
MSTVIGEKVKAGAVFNKAGVTPRWFKWNNRKIDVTEVTYTWKSVEGAAAVLHFSVTGVSSEGSGAMYEVSFNQKTLEWVLEKVET